MPLHREHGILGDWDGLGGLLNFFPCPCQVVTPSHPPLSCRPTSPSCRTCSTTSSSWEAPWTPSSLTRTRSCSSCGPHRTGPRSCCTTSVGPPGCPALLSSCPESFLAPLPSVWSFFPLPSCPTSLLILKIPPPLVYLHGPQYVLTAGPRRTWLWRGQGPAGGLGILEESLHPNPTHLIPALNSLPNLY